MPRAEHFDVLIAADHKVPSEESESRNNHRHGMVVQDLARAKQKLLRRPRRTQ